MKESKKLAVKVKIPGESKRKKTTKPPPFTIGGGAMILKSLNATHIKEISTNSKDFCFDFSAPQFKLESDAFLLDPIFTETKELDLSGNCLCKFTTGGSLIKLKYLTLDNNNLSDIIFSGMKTVVNISLSRNSLRTINDTTDLVKLVNLDLSFNQIKSGWQQLAKLKNIKVLDLGQCRIDLPPAEFHSNLLTHLKSLPKLLFLNFAGNPIEQEFPDFKFYIINELPELKYFNWEPVSKEERLQATKLASSGKWKDCTTSPLVVLKNVNSRPARTAPNTYRSKVADNADPLDEIDNVLGDYLQEKGMQTTLPPKDDKNWNELSSQSAMDLLNDLDILLPPEDLSTKTNNFESIEDINKWFESIQLDDKPSTTPGPTSTIPSTTTSTTEPDFDSKFEDILNATGLNSLLFSIENIPEIFPPTPPLPSAKPSKDIPIHEYTDDLLDNMLASLGEIDVPSPTPPPTNSIPLTSSSSAIGANEDQLLDSLLEALTEPVKPAATTSPSPPIVNSTTIPSQIQNEILDVDAIIDNLFESIPPNNIAGTTPSVTVVQKPPQAHPSPQPTPQQSPPPQPTQQQSQLPPQPPVVVMPVMESEMMILKELGKGTFGDTFLAQLKRKENDQISVKKIKEFNILDDEQTKAQLESSFKEESTRLNLLSHPNLVKLLGHCIGSTKYILWEYITGETLQKYIQNHNTYSISFVLNVARVTAEAILFLHQEGIIHGAVKTSNILIDQSGRVKITDYAFMDFKDSVHIEDSHPQYMAPELFCGEAYREKIDVYSFGMVLYELFTGEPPFSGIPIEDITHIVEESKRPSIPSSLTGSLSQLITYCWAKDPLTRPPFSNIIHILSEEDNILLPPNLSLPLRPPQKISKEDESVKAIGPAVKAPPPTSYVQPSLVSVVLPTPNFTPPQLPTTQSVSPPISLSTTASNPPSTSPAVSSHLPHPIPQFAVISTTTPILPNPNIPQQHNIAFSPPQSPSGTFYPENLLISPVPPPVNPAKSAMPRESTNSSNSSNWIPQKPPEMEPYEPLITHSSYLSPQDLETLEKILTILGGHLQSNTAFQSKAIKALYQLAPARINYLANGNELVIQGLCNLLSLAGQIGKFEIVEQAIEAMIYLAQSFPIMAERLLFPKFRTLTSLLNIVSNDDPALAKLAAKGIQELITAYPPGADLLRQAGALPRILNLLRDNDTQVLGFTVLMALLVSPVAVKVFIQSNGYEDIENMCKSRTAHLRISGMECMMYLMGSSVTNNVIQHNFKNIFFKSFNVQNLLLRDTAIKSLAKLTELAPHTLTDTEVETLITETLKFLPQSPSKTLTISCLQILYHLLKIPQNPDHVIQGKPFEKFLEMKGPGLLYRYIDTNELMIRIYTLEIINVCLKKENNDEFKQIFIDLGGLGTLSKCLDHWYTRVRLLSLQCIKPILHNQNALSILQSEIILNLSSILRYVPNDIELSSALEIIHEISLMFSEPEEKNIFVTFLENGVIESLLGILDKELPEEGGKTKEEIEFRSRAVEGAINCLSNLVSKAIFHPILIQDHSLLTLNHILQTTNHSPNLQERAAWTLFELTHFNDYATYFITTTSFLTTIMDLLKSQHHSAVTEALRLILSIARKPVYHGYLVKADPNLEVLRGLKNHELGKVQTISQKLVAVLSPKL